MTVAAQGAPLLRMSGITKTFPGVRALDGVSFDVNGGEVHALVGENGAGKSTLMKILAGAQPADGGTIEIDGKPVTIDGPRTAERLGIGMIYQEFNLVPDLGVIENIVLGVARPADLHGPAIELDRAGVGAMRAGQHLHQGRFAGAVLADQSVHFPGGDVEADAVERAHARERLDDPFHLEERGAFAHRTGGISAAFGRRCGSPRAQTCCISFISQRPAMRSAV